MLPFMGHPVRISSAGLDGACPQRGTAAAGPDAVSLAPMNDDFLFLVVMAGGLALGFKLWQWALDARAAAYRAARETCSLAVVQLLDETVAFAGFRMARDARGARRLLRHYTFDYTRDGFERSRGFIVLHGTDVDAIGLGEDRP